MARSIHSSRIAALSGRLRSASKYRVVFIALRCHCHRRPLLLPNDRVERPATMPIPRPDAAHYASRSASNALLASNDSESPSLNVAIARSCLRVGTQPNLSQWHTQQRGLPQPPTRWPLRKRPTWSSQTQATASPRCVRRWLRHTLMVRNFSTAALFIAG
jgi:hypothetical protein